ncbi:MAG: hypothetical protein KF724_06530 [Phycisphaeraceae bacterium]|nr:hypothetical protein [Phycisphaeraceae bacterium]
MNAPINSSSSVTNAPRDSAIDDLARVRVDSASDELVVLSVPGSEYRLHLKPGAPLAAFPGEPGRRVEGVINGRALRMHRASAGGAFIEPIEGHPRIVQGRVLAGDLERNRLLVRAAVPIWFDLCEGQLASDFQTGDLVNFYAESGTTFTPRQA